MPVSLRACFARHERKWPRKTIADKIGVSRNTLYRWQSGEFEPLYSQGAELLRLAGMVDG
ncbi:helix-turn-helix domain-containing protein [Nitrosovibrio tenuis]|uniref:helix-turn-helix domain-containing protein n=1 Tax=Nitrosovibrio tenuis TaxID=1233 RepID=UPI000B86BB36